MEHGTIFLDVLTVSDRLRHLDAAKVESIAASMAELGLQQPISIWVGDDGAVVELVAGAHRVAAAKNLGWEKIDCIFVDMDNLDRQLWGIDENLIRADLTDLQRAQHTAKRAEVVRQKVEFANLAKTKSDRSKNADKGQTEFVAETAKKTGQSKRTVERDKARGEKIAPDVQKEIVGTDIEDSGVQLDALAKATPDEQREAVKEVNLGHAKDVREVLPVAEGKRGKSRRTSAEVHLDNFDHSIRSISTTCSCLPHVDVPTLDDEQISRVRSNLRTATEHINKFIETIQPRRPKSRPARWAEAASTAITALGELQDIQSEYQDWLEGLPENLNESAVAEKLGSITEIDFDSAIETVSEAEDADLPLGFGRD